MKRWTQRPEGSTWGDWGDEDQLGRVNLLTRQKILEGIAEVREGRAFGRLLPKSLPDGARDKTAAHRRFSAVLASNVAAQRRRNLCWTSRCPAVVERVA